MSLSNPTNPPLVNEHVATRVSTGLVFAVDENQTKVNQLHGINPAGSTGAGIPKPVTNVQVSLANASIGSTSTLSIQFQRDPSDTNFSGVKIYAKGYQGNNSPVQVGASADSPCTVILNNTGESVTLILQSVGNGGSSPINNASSCSIKLPSNSSGGFGTSTTTNLTTAQAPAVLFQTNGVKNGSQVKLNVVAGGNGIAVTEDGAGDVTVNTFPDITSCFFGRSNQCLSNPSVLCGEPQVVWDAANSQWVLYHYFASGTVNTHFITSTSLEGPWGSDTALTTLNNYYKFRLLVDINGVPVQIGGKYYGCAVNSGATAKQIYLFSNTTGLQTNNWSIEHGGSPIIAVSGAGGAGVYDDFGCEAPYILYDSTTGKVYLWYMAFPGTSQSDFGFASRTLLAIAPSVTGTFIKQAGFVLAPSSTSTDWDFGFIGGVQVRADSGGQLFIAYNAGNTRPSSAGTEPSTSLWGFATTPSLGAAWTKVKGPFIQLTGLPLYPTGTPNSGTIGLVVDSTDIWRPYAVLDPVTNRWYVFYNTGNGASPPEKITFARQGILSFANGAYCGGIFGNNDGTVLTITTSELQVPGSQVFLRPGRYKVSYTISHGDYNGGTPKLNIAQFIRPNGTKAGQWCQSFIGSYAFENDDFTVEDYITINAPAGGSDTSQYVDCSLQVVGGTPTAGTHARNLRVVIEQL